jgi:serine/threonine protein kinase
MHSNILSIIKKFFWNFTPITDVSPHKHAPIKLNSGSYFPVDSDRRLNYDLIDIIGTGAFGTVYLAFNENGQKIAIKVRKNLKDKVLMPISNMFFQEEFLSMQSLQHPNILRVLGVESYDFNFVSIAMELIEGINLNVIIKENKSISERMIKVYTKQILDGLSYIHSENVIHRDIKSSNIMIVNNYTVKIIDFGMSKRVDGSHLPQLDENIAGTVAYMAPEMVNSSRYDARIDVWSLGVLVFEMGFGLSYVRDKSKKVTLVQNEQPVYLDNLSESANDFLEACLVK